MRAIGYCRVSTEEQGMSGAGLEAQSAAIHDAAERRGWELVAVRTEVASGKSLRKRDILGGTLRDMEAGNADVLVVAKLDRISRSVIDFATMMETARREGWAISVLDMDVDMTTPMGELVANIMISLAQWERRVIGERTRAALTAVKARGTAIGRRSNVDAETMRLMRALRRSDLSYGAIAQRLTDEGIATSQGGRWHAGTVRKLLMKETS